MSEDVQLVQQCLSGNELSMHAFLSKYQGLVFSLCLASERREHSKHEQEQVDIGEELELALDELRDDYRACFVMYHQEELSYQEIGEVLGCPQGTIKTWLHRARAQLAKRLQERGVVADPSALETT